MKKYVNVYFDVSLIKKVKELAEKEGRSFNNMVMELIRRGLKWDLIL